MIPRAMQGLAEPGENAQPGGLFAAEREGGLRALEVANGLFEGEQPDGPLACLTGESKRLARFAGLRGLEKVMGERRQAQVVVRRVGLEGGADRGVQRAPRRGCEPPYNVSRTNACENA